MKSPLLISGLILVALLGAGTLRDPEFWESINHRGDRLMEQKQYRKAATIYQDPLRKGTAQYRDGQFEAAARTFARVPGATGLYNAANAWLMHGQYEKAISTYDRALAVRPGWKEALDNKAVAIARRDLIAAAGENRDQESADAYDPDDVVADAKGSDESADKEPDTAGDGDKDSALQATWLRRVKSTPAQFLKAKFAWQAQSQTPPVQ